MVDSYVLKSDFDKIVTQRDALEATVSKLLRTRAEALTLLGYKDLVNDPNSLKNMVADLLKETILNLEESNTSLTIQRDGFMTRYLNSQTDYLALQEKSKLTDIELTETKEQVGVSQEAIQKYEEKVAQVKLLLEAQLMGVSE